MDRAGLIAAAQAKYAREQLIAQAQAKYARESAAPQISEGSPDFVSTGERLIAKNFAQSPEKQLEYLKQEHPDKEFQLHNGEVIARSKGDAQWRQIDPSFSPIDHPLATLKDLPADIGDIGYDLASGAGQGLATTAGAIGGALAGGGVGALPGAAVASGSSSAGLEALRQKLGQALGIPQEVNGTDVVLAGAAGAISPLLFGAGKATTGVVSNLARKAGVNEAILNTAENSGRGGLERGWDTAKQTVLPWLGSKVSGISKDSLKTLPGNMETVDNLEKNGVTDYVTNVMNKATGTLSKNQEEAGAAVSNAMAAANKTADVGPARQVFQSRINELENKGTPITADTDESNALKALLDKYFAKDGVQVPDQQSAPDAFELQRRLKSLAKFGKSPSSAKTLEEQQAMLLGNDAYHALNKSLDTATDGLSSEAKGEYARLKGIEEALGNSFSDPQKTFNTMTGLDKRGKILLKERLANLAKDGDLDLTKEAEVLQNYKDFANPSLAGGLFQTDNHLARKTAGAAIGGGLGYWAGANSGAGQGGAGMGGVTGAAIGAALTSPSAMRALIRANMNGEAWLKKLLQPPGGAAQYAVPIGAKLLEASPWLKMQTENAVNKLNGE